MSDLRTRGSFLLAPAVLVLAVLVGPVNAAAITDTASPRIVAKPPSVMVNTTTRLTGSHFPASKSITLEECGTTEWVVTGNPCVANDSVKVTMNSKGVFKTTFPVKWCSGGVTPGTSDTCYIGEPLPNGIDTIGLLGAVSVTVTGP